MQELIEDRDGAPYPPLAQTVIRRAAEDVEAPALLFIAPAPVPLAGGGQYLITIWQDGTGEMAWRPDRRATWGAPAPLEVAP